MHKDMANVSFSGKAMRVEKILICFFPAQLIFLTGYLHGFVQSACIDFQIAIAYVVSKVH